MKTEINTDDYSLFIVTGIDRGGRRFRLNYAPTAALVAFSINLWRGRVWGVRKADGRRELLKRTQN